MNGFAGLAPISLLPIFFFFFWENLWVSVFSILGIFFLVGLPVTLLLLLFSDFSSKFFLDFFF